MKCYSIIVTLLLISPLIGYVQTFHIFNNSKSNISELSYTSEKGSLDANASSSFQFLENAGQLTNDDIILYGQTPRGIIEFMVQGITIVDFLNKHSTHISFGNACNTPPIGQNSLGRKSTYIIGIPYRSISIEHFSSLIYDSLWPGINLTYFASSDGFKHEFRMSDSANLSDIALRFETTDISSSPILGVSSEVYSQDEESSSLVNGELLALDRILSDMDSVTLSSDVIPTNIPFYYSSFLGGSYPDESNDMAVDAYGNIYLTGSTASPNFPIESGLDDTVSGTDCFIMKLNSTGGVMYSTFIGGSGTDSGESIAIDDQNNIYVGGHTLSDDFPTVNAVNDSLGGPAPNRDGFLLKLNASGDALLYSTYIGGSDSDEVTGITLDDTYSLLAVGITSSSDFPLRNAFDTTQEGYLEAFTLRLNSSGGLVYSTFVGGSSWDEGHAIDVDTSGNSYISGMTESLDFPTRNPIDGSQNGGMDCFVAELNATGNLVFSTFIGGFRDENAMSIYIDASGNLYVTGWTESPDFPLVNPYSSTLVEGDTHCFVMKIDGAGTELLYSTFIGGSQQDIAYSIAVDPDGNMYLTGFTKSSDFPTVNAYDDIYDESNCDSFVFELNSSGDVILFSTYIGGSEDDYGESIKLGSDDTIYLIGRTSSLDFPIVRAIEGDYSDSNGFVIKMHGLTDTDSDAMPDWWESEYGLNPAIDDAHSDLDYDDLENIAEFESGTRPDINDTDSDLMLDGWEIATSLNPLSDDSQEDPDSDGLLNLDEFLHQTHPLNNDTDADIMPDGWEVMFNLNPTENDATSDADDDGLPNLSEYLAGTFPNNLDSDSDLMPDGWEVSYGLNPLFDDSSLDPDGDNLINVFEYGNNTFPDMPDSDLDSLPDGWEIDNCLDPLADDADGDLDLDNLINRFEYGNGTLANNNDTDADLMPDGWELEWGLDPLFDDAASDLDTDGLQNLYEYTIGTRPDSSDTDSDSMPDGWEVHYQLAPTDASDALLDPDGDELNNVQEYILGTNPIMADTDQDGFSDDWEVAMGFDPLNPVVPLSEFLLFFAPVLTVSLSGISVAIVLLFFVIKKHYTKKREEEQQIKQDNELNQALEELEETITKPEQE